MKRRVSWFVVGSLAMMVAGMPVASAGPRLDGMRDTITALKARDHLAIERRLTVLNGLTSRVNAATHLTSSHRSVLLGQYSSAESGLRALDAKIQSDQTVAAVRADQATIVTGYRVYVLMVPKTHIVIAADRITSIAGQLTKLQAKLEAVANKATPGSGTDAAKAALADMTKQIEKATDAVSGIASSVLPLTAGGYPGNRSVLLSARSDLVRARTALRAARGDAGRAIAGLGG